MSSPVAFGLARLAEEEAAAKAAKPGRWTASHHWERGWRVLDSPDENKATLVAWSPGLLFAEGKPGSRATADYIVLHDPARELRDIGNKRAILADYGMFISFAEELRASGQDVGNGVMTAIKILERAVRRLIARWDDHPDYDKEAWRP